MALDLADLNPEFAARLNRLEAALGNAGIGYSVVSGYRTPEYQGQMYANHLAKRAGQPLPYPNVEAPDVVAPAGRSFHNYGLAADLSLANRADYARLASMAPQYGLTGIGASDPGHIQMAGASLPSRPVTTTPGTTLYSSPLDIVLQAESGNQNINNTKQLTSSGQAQGYTQITTGTWNDFAPKAGVDLTKYPTPDSAPRDVQIAVANTIPLNRWASSTVNKVLAKYPWVDTSQTLGAIQSQALSGNAPGATQTAAGGLPGAPGAGQPPAAGGGLAANLPGFTPNSPGAKLTAQGLQTLAGGGQGTEPPPQAPPITQLPPAQAMGGPMMMRPGGQNIMGRQVAQQALAQQGVLTGPQLANAYATGARAPVPSMAPGQATGMPSMPGTTLNSPSQLQLALMTGAMNPFDLYAGAQGSGYYG